MASIVRLWNLGGVPPHLRNDEAALGYNAYSILKTARDEHGEFLPLIFQSFGDWKMGLYIYLVAPVVAIFGLNELSIRLPSAVSGIISVWLFYEVTLQIFANRKLALISGAVFALSPLYITFSRGAWEVNVSLSFTLAAVLFFLKAVNSKSRLVLLSAFFFGLTLLTSHTAKLTTPTIAGILVLAYFRQLRKISMRIIGSSILIGIIFTLPIALSFLEGKVARITTLSIFSYYPDPLTLYQSIGTRWFSLYSVSTLFIKGDINPQHTPPGMGPLFFLDFFFVVLGTVWLIKRGTFQQNFFVWVSLVLLSLPSVLTIERINLERILPMFIPLLIILSLGINFLWEFLGRLKFLPKIIPVFIFLYCINFTYFLDQYFVHDPKKNDAWQYGYKQIVEAVTPIQNQYQRIIIQQSLEYPYIFFLFYQQYDPKKYQLISKQVFIPNAEGKDMGLVSGIDNVKFEGIDWSKNIPQMREIYVMPVYKLDQQTKFFSSYKILDEIVDLNGFPVFKIVEI